jgi:hypothetical protein
MNVRTVTLIAKLKGPQDPYIEFICHSNQWLAHIKTFLINYVVVDPLTVFK